MTRKNKPHFLNTIVTATDPYLALAAVGCLLLITPVSIHAQTAYSISYTYDAQGRLKSAIYNNDTAIRYAYDESGNMTSRVVEDTGPTGVDGSSDLPDKFELYASYPNPFNPTTTIAYDVKDAANVKLVVYDLLGRRISTLIDGFQVSGRYSARFDASRLSSGMYFYKIEMGEFSSVKSMLLIR